MCHGRGYYILHIVGDRNGGEVAVAKNLVMMLDLGQPRVVLGEGLKDIHG